MKHNILLLNVFLLFLVGLSGCKEDHLTAEVPELAQTGQISQIKFVLPGAEYEISHRWKGEDLVFKLKQSENAAQDIHAEFVTDQEVLEQLTEKYAELKGINLYKLLDASHYDLPASVTLPKGQNEIDVKVTIHDAGDGVFVLPLSLKSGEKELGMQFVEVVNSSFDQIDMDWVNRTPSVAEPRMVAIIEVAENDVRNVGNYIVYPEGLAQIAKKRPLFDMTVLFSANMNFDEFTGTPVMYYNEDMKKILDNRDIFIKPLQDKGIKVLLSVMPNHQGIGFSNLDVSGDRKMIKDFAKEMADAVQQYGLDGIMFDDEYADYPELPDAVQPGRPMIQMGSFHFLIKELRDLMPLVEGQPWKDRHNLITMYNVGLYSNARIGDRGWGLFRNNIDDIKSEAGKWADEGSNGYKIREDRRALREWVKDPANQSIVDEIAQIKVGELLDFVWNANYQRGDNFNESNEGDDGSSWIAGMDAEVAKQKFGVASFEMSLEVNEYSELKHATRFWEMSNWEAGIIGRNEKIETTLQKQKISEETSMICFNLQYIPPTWQDRPYPNLYLVDFADFARGLGNTKGPKFTFEGTNYDTQKPSFMR